MKKYFYWDGNKDVGPFSPEELKAQGVTKTTKVWSEELGDWKLAGEVPELAAVFGPSPPPPPSPSSGRPRTQTAYRSSYQEDYGRPPKNYLVESILVTLFCCLPFGIVGIVNASKVESRYQGGDYEGAMIASAEAKKWTLIGFWLGLVVGIGYFMISLIGIGLSGA